MSRTIYTQFALVIISSFLLTSVVTLECYVCESCTDPNFTNQSNLKPQLCTQEVVNSMGPNPIMNATRMPFNPQYSSKEPIYVCQKIDLYDVQRGMQIVVKKCNYKVPDVCETFKSRIALRNQYQNVTCNFCETERCNHSDAIILWKPLLIGILLICFLGVANSR